MHVNTMLFFQNLINSEKMVIELSALQDHIIMETFCHNMQTSHGPGFTNSLGAT